MFRSKPYLEETKYVQINLNTPLTFPGNNQFQTKMGYKFTVIFMTGTTLIFELISSLKQKQTEVTLLVTLNQLLLTVLSHWSKVWKYFHQGKNCTRQTIFTKVFSSKICLIFQTIIQEAWQKINFGILTLTQPQSLMAMRQTSECEQERFYHREV